MCDTQGLAAKSDLAGVAGDQAADDLHKGALTGTVASHDADDLAFVNDQVDALYGTRRSERFEDAVH
jgi:hypothetical protein